MIITEISELTEYVEANLLTDISLINPSIRTVERRFLVPVLGKDQYTDLLAAYDGESLTDDQQNLLNLSQEAVANLAMAVAAPRLAVQISSAGMRRSESDTLKTAYQYQERNARESYSQSGFDALEDILAFLDENQDKFPKWLTGSGFTDYKTYFIPSGIEFSKYYQIKQSRLVYLTVAPIMRNVENFVLRDIIGKPLFTALKTGQQENTLSNAYKTLLSDYICPGIALHTIARGMLQRSLELSENGVSISLIGRNINIETKEQALLDKFQALINQMTAEADDVFKRMGEELVANPTLYPDFTAPVPRTSQMNIKNTQCQSFYGV